MKDEYGSKPATTGVRYFISYKKEDYERIVPIIHCLEKMGVQAWYDDKIPKGDDWDRKISLEIASCRAMLFFATQQAFSHDSPKRSYLKKEFYTAIDKDKDICPIWLDPIYEVEAADGLSTWFTDVKSKQGIEISDGTLNNELIARAIIKNFGLEFSTEKLLNIAFQSLQDQDYQSADEYCNDVLKQEPKNAYAYLGKLMAALHVQRQEELANCDDLLEINPNYGYVIQYGDDQLTHELCGYNSQIKKRIKEKMQTDAYNEAFYIMQNAQVEDDYRKAAGLFQGIEGYKDADPLAKACLRMAEVAKRTSAISGTNSGITSGLKRNEGRGGSGWQRIALILSCLAVAAVLMAVVVNTDLLNLHKESEPNERGEIAIIPVGGTPGFINEGFKNLFDQDKDTKWCSPFRESAHITWMTPEPVSIDSLEITSANDNSECPGRNPAAFSLLGAIDEEEYEKDIWSVIIIRDPTELTRHDRENWFTETIEIEQEIPMFQYYRIEITSTTGTDILQLSEISMSNHR